MKNINYPQFIKTLAMLLVMTGLSVACAVRMESPYITGLTLAEHGSNQPIVAVPLMNDNLTKGLGTQTERGLQFTLETVLFELDKASLLPEGQLKVEEFAKVIQQDGSRTVLIEGHADSTGEEVYNQGLSERRANTVREALIANGINPERLIMKGYGENNPVATNATKEGRQQNRRAEITLLNEGVTP